MAMLYIPNKLPLVETSIFSKMSAMANEYQAINLSQGFPDFAVDPNLIKHVHKAMKDGHNQYAAMQGYLPLREWIAEHMQENYKASYHPDTEISITAGGTEAIFSSMAAVIQPGDEVLIFEPAYDCYAPIVKLLGGIVKAVELQPPNYEIDWFLVKRMFTVNTRMIIINNPHNPTGRVFSEQDMQELIRITQDTDVLILSDEVYEHLVYDKRKHLSVAQYKALRRRSFVVYSFGKLLHTTGWKLGYVLAPEKLMQVFRKVHQFNVFSVNTPMQVGIYHYLKSDFSAALLQNMFQEKRDNFRSLLAQTKFKLLPCAGSYFQCISYNGLTAEPDEALAIRLIKEYGLASIPVSAFYNKGNDYQILRLCFAKKQETLEKAVEKLSKF